MGVRADIREEVRKETIAKIHGQPTNHDLTILEKELIAILANIPTTLGGGAMQESLWTQPDTEQLQESLSTIQPIQEIIQRMSQEMRQQE